MACGIVGGVFVGSGSGVFRGGDSGDGSTSCGNEVLVMVW